MNRNQSPGLGQWITVSLMVVVSLFLLYKLYSFTGDLHNQVNGTSP